MQIISEWGFSWRLDNKWVRWSWLTTAQINALPMTPSDEWTERYNTTTKTMRLYTGTVWKDTWGSILFLDETSTIADFATGNTYYYIGEAPITYDYDFLPYPLPVPVSGYNFVNLSVYDVFFTSNFGNYSYLLKTWQGMRDVQVVDSGVWEIQATEYIDNIYDLQKVTTKGSTTTNAIIVRNNPDIYRTRYSIIWQQIQRNDLWYTTEYIHDKINVSRSLWWQNFAINLPDISGNAPASSFIANFRADKSGTIAYLEDWNAQIITSSWATTTLTITNKSKIIITWTAENEIVSIGDATTYAIWKSYKIVSNNTEVVSIVDGSSSEIARLEPYNTIEFTLIDNITVWWIWTKEYIKPTTARMVELFDDFRSFTVAWQTNWGSVNTGAWSATGISLSLNGRYWVAFHNPGTTATWVSTIWKAISNWSWWMTFGNNACVVYETSLRLPFIPGGNEYVYQMWYLDQSWATAVQDGVFFEYDRVVSSNFWRIRTSNNSIETTVVTTIPVDLNRNKYRIEVNRSWTVAKFFVNNVFAWSININIPSTSARITDMWYRIRKTLWTNTIIPFIDYVNERLYFDR